MYGQTKKRLNVRIENDLFKRIENIKEAQNKSVNNRWREWSRTDVVEAILSGRETLEALEEKFLPNGSEKRY